MYDPTLGRWIQQDPMGVRIESLIAKVMDPMTAEVVTGARRTMFSSVTSQSSSSGELILQYTDGANLYQFVMAMPLNSVDPTGLRKWPYPLNGVVDNSSSWDVVIATDAGLFLLGAGSLAGTVLVDLKGRYKGEDDIDFVWGLGGWIKIENGTVYVTDLCLGWGATVPVFSGGRAPKPGEWVPPAPTGNEPAYSLGKFPPRSLRK